uniref:Uncharacterized protein n=1 Tax=Arundo donax TaxID=35708 RepID=A0A0A8YCP0_ARUDO
MHPSILLCKIRMTMCLIGL